MAYKTKKLKNLKSQIVDRLKPLIRFGESRHEYKKAGTDRLYIFSRQTYATYKQQLGNFAEYCKDNHPDTRQLDDCHQYVNEYIQSLIDANYSPYTLKTFVAAVCKLYGTTANDYIKTPARNRVNITRSRQRVVRDTHFSETNNAELIEFCRSTGLRRTELQHLKGDYLRIDDDGNAWLDLTGDRAKWCKGGRPRSVMVYGDKDLVIRLCTAAGNTNVFKSVPVHADIHSYRADYANRVYDAHARVDIPKDSAYHCRGDKAGTVLDKDAMLVVSRMLGHNRICIYPSNYSYNNES